MEQRRKYILIGAAMGFLLGWFISRFTGFTTYAVILGAGLGIYVGNHLAKGRGY